jgi:hypothetical protein
MKITMLRKIAFGSAVVCAGAIVLPLASSAQTVGGGLVINRPLNTSVLVTRATNRIPCGIDFTMNIDVQRVEPSTAPSGIPPWGVGQVLLQSQGRYSLLNAKPYSISGPFAPTLSVQATGTDVFRNPVKPSISMDFVAADALQPRQLLNHIDFSTDSQSVTTPYDMRVTITRTSSTYRYVCL